MGQMFYKDGSGMLIPIGTVSSPVDKTSLNPAGSVVPFAGATAPAGWLLCYGQAVSRTTYAQLFAAIGTAYGAGDGSTTFALPDLRGRVAAGLDNMGGSDAGRLSWANTLGTASGAQTHTLSTSEIPAHAHGTDSPVNIAGSGAFQGATQVSKGTTANAGGGGSHNNMQPTILLNWIISTGLPADAATKLWAEGRKTSTQTIPDVTTTVISSFNAETDTYNFFNASTGKFTIPVAGLWNFSVVWAFNADIANWNHSYIYNETQGVSVAVLRTSSGPFNNTLSGMMYCAAGNSVDFRIFADTAAGGTMNYCRFNATLLGT